MRPTTIMASTTLRIVQALGILGIPFQRASAIKGNGIVDCLGPTWNLVVKMRRC
jgi:hypothetical protein